MILNQWVIINVLLDTPPTEKTSSPKVELEFTRKKRKSWEYQVTNFKCAFPFLRDTDPNKPFLYQIYWNIDGVTVYVTDAVQKEEFQRTFLNENNGIVKMGIKVSYLLLNRVSMHFWNFIFYFYISLVCTCRLPVP